MPTRQEVYAALDSERDYQDERWGPRQVKSDGCQVEPVAAWLTYIRDYMQQAENEITREGEPFATNATMHTIRKITAMGVACMEQHGAPHR